MRSVTSRPDLGRSLGHRDGDAGVDQHEVARGRPRRRASCRSSSTPRAVRTEATSRRHDRGDLRRAAPSSEHVTHVPSTSHSSSGSVEQTGMLEAHVRELPEHVVGEAPCGRRGAPRADPSSDPDDVVGRPDLGPRAGADPDRGHPPRRSSLHHVARPSARDADATASTMSPAARAAQHAHRRRSRRSPPPAAPACP